VGDVGVTADRFVEDVEPTGFEGEKWPPLLTVRIGAPGAAVEAGKGKGASPLMGDFRPLVKVILKQCPLSP
jgi:hypothetical protein